MKPVNLGDEVSVLRWLENILIDADRERTKRFAIREAARRMMVCGVPTLSVRNLAAKYDVSVDKIDESIELGVQSFKQGRPLSFDELDPPKKPYDFDDNDPGFRRFCAQGNRMLKEKRKP